MAHEVTLITGDGVGPELAEAARRCVDATGVAIRLGRPGGGRGRDGARRHAAARGHDGKRPPHALRPEGPDHHAGRHRLPQHQRPSAAGVGPVRLHPPLQVLSRRADLLQPAAGRSGDRPREHRGPLRRHRVRGRPAGHRRTDRLHQPDFAAAADHARAATETGISIKPISISGTERIVRCAFEYARDNGRQKGHGRPQGEHHEAHRRAVPGHGPQGGPGVPRHRVRGPHRRQHVHAVGAEARAVRRAGAAEPLRRHPQRSGGRTGGRAGRGPGREHRPRRAPSSRPPTAARRSTRARTRSTPRP